MLKGALSLPQATAALLGWVLFRGRESEGKEEHALAAPSLPHDALLLDLAVDALGQVPVLSYAPDLGVELELLLQLLIVIHGCLLSGCKLQGK